jgi:hypothetical protein
VFGFKNLLRKVQELDAERHKYTEEMIGMPKKPWGTTGDTFVLDIPPIG